MGFLGKTLGLQSLSATDDGPTGDYSANVMPPRRPDARKFVQVDKAVTLIPIYRGMQIVTDLASQLTINGYRNAELLDPTPSLLVQPDPWRSLDSYIERYIVSMIADGNAFIRRFRGPGGGVVAHEILNPFKVTVRWDKGVKSYAYTTDSGKAVTFKHEDVKHIWWMEIPGRTRGIGPLQAAGMDIAGWLDLREFAASWFDNDDVPSGVLTSDQTLDPTAINQYRKVWRNPGAFDDEADKHVGPSIRVLGKGLKYDPVRISPSDAQYVEIERGAVLSAARMLGLPADYLLAAVEGKSMTYANLEMIDGQFIKLTLFPRYLRKLQSALTEDLVRGQSAGFSFGEFGKPDSKTQAEIDKTYIDAGVYDPTHVRRRLGIPGAAPRKPATAPQPAGDPA